jgi:hypothetical protein
MAPLSGAPAQLPTAIDNSIDRFRLAQVNRQLETELADREHTAL